MEALIITDISITLVAIIATFTYMRKLSKKIKELNYALDALSEGVFEMNDHIIERYDSDLKDIHNYIESVADSLQHDISKISTKINRLTRGGKRVKK